MKKEPGAPENGIKHSFGVFFLRWGKSWCYTICSVDRLYGKYQRRHFDYD
jgi:hypothetical protein